MDVLDDFDPRRGVAYRDPTGYHPVIKLPRNESLRILPKSGMMQIYDCLIAFEMSMKKSLERGNSRRIFSDGASGGSPMYSSVGVQVSRTGGVIERNSCTVPHKYWKELIKMTRRAENAMESFADNSVICQLSAAKEAVPFMTMSALCNRFHVKYFGAIAFGRNVFLRCHTDEDFTMSVTQVYIKGCDCYQAGDKIVAYFCFPTIGVAIPMRAGDYVIFDATIPHCISSRCHIDDELMCVSFYLKSRVVGMNNNSFPTTADQIRLSALHDKMDTL
jgi:hypothetical protein